MGQEIRSAQFKPRDFRAFSARLTSETEALRQRFLEQAFTCASPVGGFELEAWLVDKEAVPVPENIEFLELLSNPEVVPELSLFNFEINVVPQILRGAALARFHQNLRFNWEHCRRVAKQNERNVMAIGVHPVIDDAQLVPANMSQSQRYKALNEQIFAMRQQRPIGIDIHGRQHLELVHHDVMLEAATTSFQIHLQVEQRHAVRTYNAAQIVSGPLVGLSANAPYLFGVDVCAESRIPLFEQSVDLGENYKQRVTFGSGYVKASLMECFQENIDAYPVLIPASKFADDGDFAHVRLHNGTIWRWNRPLIGFNDDGSPHLRIENRVVPAGPTMVDMIANAAFYWGLVQSLVDDALAPESRLPFAAARDNFYAAVRDGLDCDITWLDGKRYGCCELLVQELLPRARDGLYAQGIDGADISRYLDVLVHRVESRQNGTTWQRRWVEKHGHDMTGLSQAYLEKQSSDTPVHEWTL